MVQTKRFVFGSDTVFDVVVNGLVFLLTAIVFYPLFFVVIASFSDPNLVSAGKVILLPKGVSLSGYQYILQDRRIWVGYRNTLIYTFFGTLLGLFITLPGGYALSRVDMIGRGLIMKIMVFTKYFSGGLIPTYLLIKRLHLIDTPFILIILGSFSVFNLILARTFFVNTLPLELQEAAEVDGCTIPQYFFMVVLPLSSAITAILALYYAVGHWNSFFSALIYINKAGLYPLQLILRDILILGQTIQADITDAETLEEMQKISKAIKYGVIIVSSLPVMIMYPFIQKYFVKGVMIGSIKG